MPGGMELALRLAMVLEAGVFGLVGVAVSRRAGEPGALGLSGVAGSLAAVSLLAAVAGGLGSPTSLTWAVYATLFLVFVTCWLWFVAAYIGQTRSLPTRHQALVTTVPVVGLLSIASLYLTRHPIPRPVPTGGPTASLPLLVPALFVTGLLLASVAVLLQSGVQYSSARLASITAVSVAAVAGGLLPGAFSALLRGTAGYSLLGLVTAHGLSALGLVLSVRRYELFDAAPVTEAIGRDRLVTEIDDLVLVVDPEGRIVDLNAAAAATLADSHDSLVGRDLGAVLGFDGAVEDLDTVDVRTVEGLRSFEASSSEIQAAAGRFVGHALVLRDVTERETRRQRLEVLNRVLRHNLRNDMTAVMGYATLIADEPDNEDALIERIRARADALAELGDKAREIEGIMAATGTDERTDAARVVQYVAEEAEKTYPAASVTVDLEGDVTVAAAEEVLWPVVWNLVENAVEHHDGENPEIRLVVGPEDADAARIVVADDGPGIPDAEREAIAAGEERPLAHATGLGLWAVKWGVTRLGGELTFEPNEPRGSLVSVRLPRAEGDRATADVTGAA